jgi:hypothetical protein
MYPSAGSSSLLRHLCTARRTRDRRATTSFELYYARLGHLTRTLTAGISTSCQITHYQALRAALSWSGCASFANRLSTSPGRLFLGLLLPSSHCAPFHYLVSPVSLSDGNLQWCKLPAFGAIHLERCKYPPAFPSHLSPLSTVLGSIQSSCSPPSKRPETKGWRFAPLPLLLSSLQQVSYCNTSCVFCLLSSCICTFIDWSKLVWIIVAILTAFPISFTAPT